MSELRDSLKKIVMAGFEAVGSGLEKTQEVLTGLADQGKEGLAQAAEAFRQAFEGKTPELKKEELLSLIRTLPLSTLRELRGRLDALIAAREEAVAKSRPALPGEFTISDSEKQDGDSDP